MIPVEMSRLSFVLSWEKKKNNKGKDYVLTYLILKPDISLMYLESSDQESEGQC